MKRNNLPTNYLCFKISPCFECCVLYFE